MMKPTPESVKDKSIDIASQPDDTITATEGMDKAQKPKNNPYLNVPLQATFGTSQETLSDVTSLGEEASNIRGLYPTPPQLRIPSRSPDPDNMSWKSKWHAFVQRNKGVALVILAQLFGALMAATTRLLETDDGNGEPMGTFQILFFRMSITMVASLLYMWIGKVENAPFGVREIRWLLIARGLGGFFGVFGLYYSLVYLPLAEATVITFLAPMVAAYASHLLFRASFSRVQQLGGIISILGVVLISQPFRFNTAGPTPTESPYQPTPPNSTQNVSIHYRRDHTPMHVSPSQHAFAILIALLGVCGAACAYTTISWIGKRAHPLIMVNYFAVWCTFVSLVAIFFIPGVTFRSPATLREWILMLSLGFCGFIMQFLLTKGLAHDKSTRALNMVYIQMLFALLFDKVLFDTKPGVVSILGSCLILGSAVWIAIKKDGEKDRNERGGEDEERGLIDGLEEERGRRRNEEERDPRELALRTIRV